jgi:hypothetical protein
MYRSNFEAMSARAAELAARVTAVEQERDAALKLRESMMHAAAHLQQEHELQVAELSRQLDDAHQAYAALAGRETTATIAAWADGVFGEPASNISTWYRAMSEMDELREKLAISDVHPDAAAEAADVVIVLARLLSRLGTTMQAEVDRKMAINRARRWDLTGDGHGQHVKEGL